MRPGRELDALIAEKVMGIEVVIHPERYLLIAGDGGDFFGKNFVTTILCHNQTFEKHSPGKTIKILPYYSTNIPDAWAVVEKLRSLNGGDVGEFRLTWSGHKKDGYVFRIWENDLPQVDLKDFEGESAPHAICLAALKAMGVNYD